MAAVKGWTLKEAQELVAAMRSKVNQYGYEITVGGTVLTLGSSSNDLDLFFVPRSNSHTPLPIDLLMWIASKLGAGKTIVSAVKDNNVAVNPGIGPGLPPSRETFLHKMRFDLGGRKIDVFVV